MCVAAIIVAATFIAARAYADYIVAQEQEVNREQHKKRRQMFEDARREGREAALWSGRWGL